MMINFIKPGGFAILSGAMQLKMVSSSWMVLIDTLLQPDVLLNSHFFRGFLVGKHLEHMAVLTDM